MTDPQKEAFIRLIQEQERLLFKVCHCYTTGSADREDLYQEIVLQCWKAWPRFSGRSAAGTWLYRIAFNTAITHRRKEGRRLVPAQGLSDQEHLLQLPAQDAAAADQLQLMYRLIGDLPPLDRALLLLYLEDRPHAEIAEIIGISTTNVTARLSRIRGRLRQRAQQVQN